MTDSTIRPGMPVVVLPDGDPLSKRARTDVVAVGPFTAGGEECVRLASNWNDVPVTHVRPHWLAAEVTGLDKPEPIELDFPYPPCSRCGVETEHDGDGFTCPQCLARWSDRGGDGVMPCVEESDHEASVVGADGQPRCVLCETRVRTGEIEAADPYDCRRCKTKVVGIGPQFNTGAARNRRCGECQVAVESDEWWANWRAERASGGRS